ncbi:acetate--CoA ligase family protein [Helicobacter cappadocius]|uniref:Acetate--CoA ligase family protein n=1 Tax=Helicobacter cappadocius TaxID=3063998 RepID=A0AA90T9Z7_9HELI|nr:MULTISPECIES: acetate--CoA ligase family protein [unclassified Helicobacter]MDO7253465.1 acetate--CoA ligase family protein [Helicobacter sp. faydin-H75]MDP2539392.1 acetate--CoA ligase family protein [Helicobacter sp. faydin-H76]
MTESELYQWLGKYGIKTPCCKVVGMNEEISVDFFPAVLKIQSPKVIHKSDVGGVILNLNSNEEIKNAREKMKKNIQDVHKIPLDNNDCFIITQMLQGEELYIGSVEDNVFGNVILFGKGGIYLELYKDICYIDSNAQEDEILRAFKNTKISKLFEGYRGSNHQMIEVITLVKNIQKLINENPDIKELDINPLKLTKDGLIAVDARIKKSSSISKESLRKSTRPDFLHNQRVAIIGASTDKTKAGYVVAKNSIGFKGELFFVNQKGGQLLEKPLLKSIEEIQGNIDTAVLAIPAKFVIPTIKELIPRGLKNLIVITAGFKESGHQEEELEIGKLAEENNFNVLGPNCLGYFNDSTNLNLTFGTGNLKTGHLAFISQSGAVLAGLMDYANALDIGFSHIMSTGNAVDLESSDLIPMLDRDPNAKSISLYLEGISKGKELLKNIRNTKKPIFLFKSGKSEEAAKAAFSHTGNLSGNYDMFSGLMKSLNVRVVDNIEALILKPLFHNSKEIAIITNAGGPGTVLTDAIVARGKKLYSLNEQNIRALNAILPEHWSHNNPIDIIGDALADRYKASLDVVDNFDGVDFIYMLITPQDMTDPLGSVKILKEKTYKHKVIPILIGGNMVEEARIFCKTNKILFFSSITEATSFL